MSRLGLSLPAEREARAARLLLSGPPGCGLTYTSLVAAHRLAGGDQFLVIDTERRSALVYAGLFPFEHLPWASPYDVDELAGDVFDGAARWPVVVVDCLSRFWTDTGGIRDVADGVGRGSRPSGWDQARPMQRRLMAAMTECRAHLVVTCRPQVEQVATVDETGRARMTALAGRLFQDDSLPGEFDVHATIDPASHGLTIAKSRVPVIRQGAVWDAADVEALADVYGKWCTEGAPLADLDDVQLIADRLDQLPEADKVRLSGKRRFHAAFGKPQYLRASQVPEANQLVQAIEDEANGKDPAARAAEMADRVSQERAAARTGAGKDAAVPS